MHISSLKAEEFEKFLTHKIVENKYLSNECNLHLWNGYSMWNQLHVCGMCYLSRILRKILILLREHLEQCFPDILDYHHNTYISNLYIQSMHRHACVLIYMHTNRCAHRQRLYKVGLSLYLWCTINFYLISSMENNADPRPTE